MYTVQELFAEYESYTSNRNGDDAVVEAAAVVAHPDDEIILSNAIAHANEFGMRIHGFTLTPGELTTKNFRAYEGFDPRLAHRTDEAREGALGAGFVSHEQFFGVDGDLENNRSWMAGAISELLIAHDVSLVLSISQMGAGDSYDHTSAGNIAHDAANMAAIAHGQHIGVLTVQPNSRGVWQADSSAASLDIVRKVASANDSQFRIGPAEDRPADWIPVSSGYSMHPEDWAELGQYPMDGVACHSYMQYGHVLVPRMAEL